MKQYTKFAAIGFAASTLLTLGFSSTAAATPKTETNTTKSVVKPKITSTTVKSPFPNGKPFQYLNSRIDSLQDQIDLLVGRVHSLEEWEVKAQLALDKLEVDVNKNATAIALLQGQIADINDILKTKQDIINHECPDNQYLYKISATEGLVCRTDLGSNGLAMLTVKNVVSVPVSSTPVDVNATCPAGSAPTGGSFNAPQDLTVNSFGITPEGYSVNVTNTSSTLEVSVTATCLAVNP